MYLQTFLIFFLNIFLISLEKKLFFYTRITIRFYVFFIYLKNLKNSPLIKNIYKF